MANKIATLLVIAVSLIAIPFFGVRLYNQMSTDRARVRWNGAPATINQAEVRRLCPIAGRCIVVAVTKDCVHCLASVPYYRQLLSALPPSTTVVALFPKHDRESGPRLLRDLGADFPNVKYGDLAAFGVAGTPAIIGVGGDGAVSVLMQGRLDQNRLSQLTSRISALNPR